MKTSELQRRVVELEQRLVAARREIERLRQVVRCTPMALGVIDPENSKIMPNAVMEECFGPGSHAFEEVEAFAHPEDRADLSAALREIVSGQRQSFKKELRFSDASNEQRWGLVTVARDDQQADSFAILAIIDITELKRTKERLKIVTDKLPIGVAITQQAGGNIVYINPAAARSLGFTVEELTGSRSPALYEPPSERQRLLARLARDGSVSDFEIWMRSRSGQRRRMRVSLEPILYNDELCLMGSGVDVTREYEARRQCETIAEVTPVAVTVVRRSDDTIVYANLAFAELMGAMVRELLGYPAPAFLANASDETTLRGELDSRGSLRGYEVRMRRVDGSRFLASLDVLPFSLNGEACFMVAISDVTYLRETERSLKQSLEEKVNLLHEMNHRVGNSLQLISSLLYLEMEQLTHDGARSALEQTRRRVVTMGEIHQILHESGELSRVRMDKALRQIAAQAHGRDSVHEAASLQIEASPVELELEQALPCALIVSELLAGASQDFQQGRGTARLSCVMDQGKFRLEVLYEGIGMDDPRAFVDKSAGHLGMQLIKALARQLDASMDVQSTQLGGLRFRLTFSFLDAVAARSDIDADSR